MVKNFIFKLHACIQPNSRWRQVLLSVICGTNFSVMNEIKAIFFTGIFFSLLKIFEEDLWASPHQGVRQCETPKNAFEDQNKWYEAVELSIKFMKHWLTNHTLNWDCEKNQNLLGNWTPGLSITWQVLIFSLSQFNLCLLPVLPHKFLFPMRNLTCKIQNSLNLLKMYMLFSFPRYAYQQSAHPSQLGHRIQHSSCHWHLWIYGCMPILG